jgi:hypothetical protein
LKQAPRIWFQEVRKFFENIGLKATHSDPNLFIGNGVYILLYVDDMLIIGNRGNIDAVKSKIKTKWNCKDVNSRTPHSFIFVGFQVDRERKAKSITIHQELYITKLLEQFKMDKANPTATPLPTGTVLKPVDQSESSDELLDPMGIILYRQIVGSVIYLSNCTRPDIAYAVGQLARFMATPSIFHLKMAKHLLRYLRGSPRLGPTYKIGPEKGEYSVFSDATWGTESDRVSFQGWITIRTGGAISWAAQRQRSTALSSMEAEFMSACDASREIAWLEYFITNSKSRHSIFPNRAIQTVRYPT